jgi:predicted Fe-S protein YdhL (DUF1289 family)
MSEHQDDATLAAETAAWRKLTPEERLAILAKLNAHDPQWPYTTPEFRQTAESLVGAGLVICAERNGMTVFRAIRADEIRDSRDRKAFTEALAAATEVDRAVKSQGSTATTGSIATYEELVAGFEYPAARRAGALSRMSPKKRAGAWVEMSPDDCELVIKYLSPKKRAEVLSYSTPEQAAQLRERRDFWADPAAAWAKLTPEERKKQLNRVKENLRAMGLIEPLRLIRTQ